MPLRGRQRLSSQQLKNKPLGLTSSKPKSTKHRRTVDVECAVRLTKLLIISSANAAKWRRKNIRIDMIGSGEESTGTYAGTLRYM